MRVLVTGAAGMLGQDMLRHLGGRHEVTGVDLDVDVTDPAAVRACVAEVRPEAVFHLAAWTDVDGAEEREADAARVNADGAGNVAAAAAEVGAAVVVPSTDYVFDGRGVRDVHVQVDARHLVSAVEVAQQVPPEHPGRAGHQHPHG